MTDLSEIRRRSGVLTSCVLFVVLLATPGLAQEPPQIPSTRAEAIDVARADKLAQLWPERQPAMVDLVNGLVEENPKLHEKRWRGLVEWWQELLGNVRQSLPHETDVLNMNRPDAAPTPVPPDRRAGAAPEQIQDAAQEFLTDRLVGHQYEQALEFLSPRSSPV